MLADAVLNTSVTMGLPEGLAEMLGAPVLPLGVELGVEPGGGQGYWIEMIFSWQSLESQPPALSEPKAP